MSFELTQLSSTVFAIKELDDRNLNPLCYLLRGSERVVLIDTGCGCGNMFTYVRSLEMVKDLKILVINTHNHREQTGGNWRFSTTGKFGLGLQVEALCASKRHKFYTRLMDSDWHWEVYTYKVTKWLNDEEIIQLGGGEEIQILWTPGHTPDSLVIWYEQEKRLFLGDLFYRFDDIPFKSISPRSNGKNLNYSYPHVDIKAYESSVRRILNLVTEREDCREIRFSSAKNDMDERCLPLLKLYHRFLLSVLAGTHIGAQLRIDDAEGWRYETRDKGMRIVLGRDTVRKLNEAREKMQSSR